jgi:hypothetical protein
MSTRPVVPKLRSLLLAAFAALVLTAGLPTGAHAAQSAGVQAHLLWSGVSSAEVDLQLDAAKNANARVIRVDVGWAGLEPAKGQWSAWDLARLDHVVDSANARGLDLLLTFWETPCWASSAPESAKQGCAGAWWDRGVQLHPPVNASDYARALAYVVKRYGTRVRAWEIWNEPNSYDYFRSTSPVRDYAALVKAAYPAAKVVAPTSTIVAGSLMWADAAFTKSLFAEGIKGCFDAFSIHPYSDDRSPMDPGDDAYIRGSFIRGVPAVRKVLVDQGDPKPLWLTEFGWATTTVRGSSPWLNGVSEATQASFIKIAYEQMQKWSYVDVGIYFNVFDTNESRGAAQGNFGLMRNDHTAKPALGAFRTAAHAVVAAGVAAPVAAASAAAVAPAGSPAAAAVAGWSATSTVKPAKQLTRSQLARAARARVSERRYRLKMARQARLAIAKCKKR